MVLGFRYFVLGKPHLKREELYDISTLRIENHLMTFPSRKIAIRILVSMSACNTASVRAIVMSKRRAYSVSTALGTAAYLVITLISKQALVYFTMCLSSIN